MCCISESYHTNKSVPVTAMPTIIDSLAMKKSTGASRMRIRPPRRVSFQQTEFYHSTSSKHTDSPAILTTQERNKLWYHPQDLLGFKVEAREVARRIRTSRSSECARGLEHRISMERQKNKYLAIRAILKAQDQCCSPAELATVASRCSAWAQEVALLAGHADYYMAYNPELAHLVPKTPTMQHSLVGMIEHHHQRKRAVEVIVIDDDEPQARRTRPRLSIAQTSTHRRVSFVNIE